MKYSKILLISSIGLGALAVSASADVVTQISSMSGDQNWNDAQFWSNGETPSAANDYVTAGSFTVRTPNSGGNVTFGGNSLTLRDTASLFLRASGSNQATIDRLLIETNSMASGSQVGPRIQSAVAGESRLNGIVELTGSGSVTLDPDFATRTLTINSQLMAQSTVQQIIARGRTEAGTVLLTNSNNVFGGTWVVQHAVLRGSENGSFGTGNFEVRLDGVLDFGYDFANTQSSLAIEEGGKLMLSRDLTLGAVSVAGSSLDAGTYTFDQLNAQYDGYFVGTSGIGSITVVPESSHVAVTMVGIVSVLLLCRTRRRN